MLSLNYLRNACERRTIFLSGLRKGYTFCRKWYIKGQGVQSTPRRARGPEKRSVRYSAPINTFYKSFVHLRAAISLNTLKIRRYECIPFYSIWNSLVEKTTQTMKQFTINWFKSKRWLMLILIGHFCCSRCLYMNAKNRKVIDANILPMTQRPLQKVTYKTSKLAKDKKKKQSEQSTQYCKKTLSKSQQSSAVQIYDRLFLYRVEF